MTIRISRNRLDMGGKPIRNLATPTGSEDATTKGQLDTHAGLTAAHSAVSTATASRIVVRDASGRAAFAAPSAAGDVAINSTVTTHAGLTAAGTHGSATAATANTLVHRDAAGRAKVVAPSAADDIALLSSITKTQVGLANVTNDAQLPIAGGTMTGILYPQNNTSYTTGQARRIILSTGDPTGGSNGDLWVKYTA